MFIKQEVSLSVVYVYEAKSFTECLTNFCLFVSGKRKEAEEKHETFCLFVSRKEGFVSERSRRKGRNKRRITTICFKKKKKHKVTTNN